MWKQVLIGIVGVLVLGIACSVYLMITKPFTLMELGEDLHINGIGLAWIFGVGSAVVVSILFALVKFVFAQAKIRRAYAKTWEAVIIDNGLLFDSPVMWGATKAQNSGWGEGVNYMCLVAARVNTYGSDGRYGGKIPCLEISFMSHPKNPIKRIARVPIPPGKIDQARQVADHLSQVSLFDPSQSAWATSWIVHDVAADIGSTV